MKKDGAKPAGEEDLEYATSFSLVFTIIVIKIKEYKYVERNSKLIVNKMP